MKTKWLFRGTTQYWEGNTANRELPRTSTTTNPLIAILFARSCRNKGSSPIVFIAKQEKLNHLDDTANCLAVQEGENAFRIKPTNFANYAEGYINLEDAIIICRQLKLKQPFFMGDGMFDNSLGEIENLSEQEIEKFVALAQRFVKQV